MREKNLFHTIDYMSRLTDDRVYHITREGNLLLEEMLRVFKRYNISPKVEEDSSKILNCNKLKTMKLCLI